MASYGWTYAVQVGIGTGPGLKYYMLQLDLTGVLTWMQCEPSVPDLPQTSPIFDSSESPTYGYVDARRCKAPYTPAGQDSTGIMSPQRPSAVPAYHIRVIGVLLNRQELSDIPANAFQGGCGVDVGTTMSRMIQPAYGVLDHALMAHLARFGAQRFAVPGYNLCVLDTPVIRANLPSMALDLYGGTLLDIAPAQLFVVVSDQGNQYLCFTVVPDEHQTVLGAMQQVNTQFVFDLPNNKISFAPAQC
ncbi:hypothetical protein EJB05_10606, partial [Eragrostis curvula]